MRLTVDEIICQINDTLQSALPGSKFYGIVDYLTRDGKVEPHVNERPVSFDDVYRMSGYHKIARITPRKTGFNILNTYNCSLVVYNGLGLDNYYIAESVLSIINSIVTVTDIVLSSEVVFQTEYRGHAYTGVHLIQVNYTIEAAIRANCCTPVSNCLNSKLN